MSTQASFSSHLCIGYSYVERILSVCMYLTLFFLIFRGKSWVFYIPSAESQVHVAKKGQRVNIFVFANHIQFLLYLCFSVFITSKNVDTSLEGQSTEHCWRHLVPAGLLPPTPIKQINFKNIKIWRLFFLKKIILFVIGLRRKEIEMGKGRQRGRDTRSPA